jgi:hypothetical protein
MDHKNKGFHTYVIEPLDINPQIFTTFRASSSVHNLAEPNGTKYVVCACSLNYTFKTCTLIYYILTNLEQMNIFMYKNQKHFMTRPINMMSTF